MCSQRPRARKAEDGPIDGHYPLAETPSTASSPRTRWNVRDADVALILSRGAPIGGTLLTVIACRSAGKPHLLINMAARAGLAEAVQATREWVKANAGGGVLNVAGPRASKHPGVYEAARSFMRAVLVGWET
jgi:hypothetical protein